MTSCSDRYTITISGERFVFTREQLESEPGNYFATYFLGDFAESKNGVKELVIEKEPLLFKLIQAHLRGYEILPLADAVIPSYMTKEVALINLFRESQYYSLQRLEERIKHHQPSIVNLAAEMPIPQQSSPTAYKFAKFIKNTGWVINDTTADGYQTILASFATSPGKVLIANQKLSCPGFTQVISWRDAPDDLYSTCALLAADSNAAESHVPSH